MTAKLADCTCWMVPDESARVAPLTWVCLHDEVRLVRQDGEAAQGWSIGANWWGPEDAPALLVDVETRGGSMLAATVDEIATITPVGGITEVEPFLEAVAALVQAPSLTPDEGYLTWIVNAHKTVEIEVRHIVHRCSPPTRPGWATEKEGAE